MQTFLFMRLKQSFLLTFVLINFTIYTVRAINVGMDNEKYITIKELAELKGVSTRAIRLSKGKYITREITVKGGKSFEILLSSIEPELQEKYYSKLVLIPPIKQLPIIADFHKQNKAKIIALARFDLVNLWKEQRKQQARKNQFDADFLNVYNANTLYPEIYAKIGKVSICLLYTSPSPRD